MEALNLVDNLINTIDKQCTQPSNYDQKNIFKLILDGKIPCYKIFETDSALAILDAFPVCSGHSLLISKVCKPSIEDFTELETANYLSNLPKLCKLVKKATNATAVNIISNVGKDAGQMVFHAHFHVIPRHNNDKLIKFPKSAEKMIEKDIALNILNKMKSDNIEENKEDNISIFKNDEIIPDVVDEEPKQIINIVYNGKNNDGVYKVDKGNELKPINVFNAPKIEYIAEKNTFYTLIFTDPDARDRIKHEYREWVHWVTINIPENDISKGYSLIDYVGSGPPKDTGLHRYVFLLYKQKNKIDVNKCGQKKLIAKGGGFVDRRNFSAKKFAKNNYMVLVGGNYFNAQYDESVPELGKWVLGK